MRRHPTILFDHGLGNGVQRIRTVSQTGHMFNHGRVKLADVTRWTTMMHVDKSERLAAASDALNRTFLLAADRLRSPKESHRNRLKFFGGIPVADRAVLTIDSEYSLNHDLPRKPKAAYHKTISVAVESHLV